MTKRREVEPPTYVVSGPRQVSISSDAVLTALASNKKYHAIYLVYRLLEKLNGTGAATPTNRELARELDLHRDTVQKHVATLENLGLITVLVALDQTRTITLPPQLPAQTLRALEALGAGALEIDVKASKVTVAITGEEYRPVLVLPEEPTVPRPYVPQTLRSPDRTPYGPQTVGTPETEPEVVGVSTCESSPCEQSGSEDENAGEFSPVYFHVSSNSVLQDAVPQYYKEHNYIRENNSPEPDQLDLIVVPESKPKRKTPKSPGRPAKPIEPEVQVVMDFWREHLGYQDRGPTWKRVGYIRGRLKDGFTVEQLCDVVRHAKLDPWLNGTHPKNTLQRRYDDITNLMGSRDKVERYLANHKRGYHGVDMRRSDQGNHLRPSTGYEVF